MQAQHTINTAITSVLTKLRSAAMSRLPARYGFAKSASEEGLYDAYCPLALWSQTLYALGTNAKADLSQDEELQVVSATALAKAAASLVNAPASRSNATAATQDAEVKDAKASHAGPIALFLPSHEFVATTVALPGLAASAARQALLLQADGLIPSLEEPLVLIQNPSPIPGSDSYLCLWMRAERLDSLSQAFDDCGQVLAAVAPRALLSESAAPTLSLSEQDAQAITATVFNDGKLVQWLSTRVEDLAAPELLHQWQAEQKAAELANAAVKQEHTSPDWYRLPSAQDAARRVLTHGYFLRTASEIRRRSSEAAHRALKFAGASVVALLVLALLPFVLQSLQFRLAARELHALREQNDAARQDQAYVADFESTWGEVNDFPQQDVVAVMYELQRLISPDTLTALEIDEGLITIEGSSSNPQAILQRLEQDPLFTEVVFARATNNSRYYIDLRLTTVSFEGYRARYLEEAR